MTESTKFPAGPSLPGQTSQGGSGEPNARLIGMPGDLSNLARAIQIVGEVARDAPEGIVRVITPQGEVDIQVTDRRVNLRPGDSVTVDIPPGRPPRTATVTPEAPPPPQTELPRTTSTPVEIEVRPPTQQLPDLPNVTQTARPSAPASVPEVLAKLEPLPPQQAAQLIDTLLEDTAGALPKIIEAAVQVSLLKNQDSLLEQIVTLVAPKTAASIQTPVLTQSIAPQNPIATPQPAVTVTPPIPTQTEASLTTPTIPQPGITPNIAPPLETPEISLTPPAAPQAPKQSAPIIQSETPKDFSTPKAETIPGIIIGQTPDKVPVVAVFAPRQPMPLFFTIPGLPKTVATITPGTIITLTPQAESPAPQQAAIQAAVNFAPPLPPFTTAEPWPLLEEILQTLQPIAPQAARAFSNIIPSPANPAQLGPAALFFIAAIRGGDLTQWLGEKTSELLRRIGRTNLLSRLGQEGNTLNRQSAEPNAQDWRALSLPMAWQNQMQKIAVFYKQDHSNQNDKDQGGKQTRFVFDLSFDRMGPVQLDGLFKSPRLDLIVRTKIPLSAPMQMNMRKIYADALGQTQISGELSFQNKPEQWVTIQKQRESVGLSA